jgi:hypothetical protein
LSRFLQDTYGHHHPDYLHGAAAAIGQKGRYVSVVETVVVARPPHADSRRRKDTPRKPAFFEFGTGFLPPETGAPKGA